MTNAFASLYSVIKAQKIGIRESLRKFGQASKLDCKFFFRKLPST